MTDFDIYTYADKIKALAALSDNHGDIFKTHAQTGIPYAVLQVWAKDQGVTLNDRLVKAAYRLLAALPDKLDKADLQQIVRALSVVLDNIKQDDSAEGGQRVDVYEKLARIMDQYTAARSMDTDAEAVHEGGTG